MTTRRSSFSMVVSLCAKLLITRKLNFASSLVTNTIMTQSRKEAAALIFLHGLGDTPSGWSSLKSALPSIRPNLSNLTYSFPAAPTIPISINGGFRMPGWFDIYSWPIAIGDRDDKAGIIAAVREVEKHVDMLRKSGIPHERIVIGGFSQGAAIALQAVYNDAVKADKDIQYAACVCLSGWLTLIDDISDNGLSDMKTPLFWGHGLHDDKVLFEQQNFGENKLREQGIKTLISKQYSTGHSSTDQEIQDLANFIDDILFGNLREEF